MTDTILSPRPAHTQGPWRISDNPYGAIVSDHPTGRIGEAGYTTADGLHFPGDCGAYGGYVICESVLACNKPLIAGVRETPVGRVASLMLPRFSDELYQDRQHLLDGVRMGRRAGAGRDPLLEDAELLGAVSRRNRHAGFDARSP